MRKGSEGLYGLVRDTLGYNPLSGHLFLAGSKLCSGTVAGFGSAPRGWRRVAFAGPDQLMASAYGCSRKNWRCCLAGSIWIGPNGAAAGFIGARAGCMNYFFFLED